MTLLYLWIEKYKGISDIGLNFSNQYRFVYDEKKHSLNVEVAENYISGFFGPDITDFTTIIGINSAGKTTVLRYVIEFCTSGIHNHFDENGIAIYKDENTIYYYCSKELTITGKLDGQLEKTAIKRVKNLDNFKMNTGAVYLSNHFDPTPYYATDYSTTQFGETQNVSTWHLLHNDYQNRTGEDARNPTVTFAAKLGAFATQEFIRIVKLMRWINIDSDQRNPFPVKLPDFINLTLYFNNESKNDTLLSQLTKKLNKHFKTEKNRANTFLLRSFQAAVYHLIDEEKFVSSPSSIDIKKKYLEISDRILEYIDENVYKGDSKETILPEIHDLLIYLLDSYRGFQPIMFRLSNIWHFLGEVGVYMFNEYVQIDEKANTLSIEISKAKIDELVHVIELFYNEERIGNYAEFYFSHRPFGESSLSSGEYSLLSIFARLNSLKFERKSSILLLLDEAELALHPEWQLQFVTLLTNFIAGRFKGIKTQIIITSHSPLILSDFPPHCIIFLLKDKATRQTKVIDGLATKKETFGANVHELFTDTFFLSDGLMGQFARTKIKILLEEVNKKESYTLSEYNLLKKEIDIIGEPFVRYKILEKILNGLPDADYDNVISEREKELNLLKYIKHDKNRTK